jgi:hypothetical protein
VRTSIFVKTALTATNLLSLSLAPVFAQVIRPSTAFAQQQLAAATHAHGAPLVPLTPAPTTQTVDIFSFRNPDTGEKVQVQYQPSPRETLRKYKPSQVRKMITEGFPPRPGIKGLAKEFALDFPAEFIAFSGALLLSSSIHANNDPASMKHFIDQNVLDPAAYVSFAGFLVGSRASHAALRAMGMAYDPYRNAPDYRLSTPMQPGSITGMAVNGATGEIELTRGAARPDHLNTRVVKVPGAPTRAQTRFAPLLGPIGLGVGMTFSNVIHEVIADQDIRACSKARSTPSVPQEQADEICDKAWENWALSKKAADYTPDILAMGSAALIQAYIVNKSIGWGVKKTGEQLTKAMGTISTKTVTTGAEKIIPFVFRGYRLVTVVGMQHPVGRFAMTVGNIAIFMEIVHPITPWFKKPFESVRQGANLASEIRSIRNELDRAEKNSWKWKPQVVSWCEPTANPRDPYVMKMRFDFGCPESKNPSPSVLLKKHAERQTKWREQVLQEAFQAHSNWQDHVSKFATMYSNATNFYEQMIQHLNYQKFHKNARLAPSSLFQAAPFYGISSDGTDHSNESKRKAIAAAHDWLEKYLQSGKRLHSTERAILPEILLGLKAADPKSDIKALAPIQTGIRNIDGMTADQRADFEVRVRESLLQRSLVKLREVLENDQFYTDRFSPFGTDLYARMAEANPFMKLRILLGNPEPLEAGIAFLRGSNEDSNIIEQETKMDHPDGIGRARTNSMADYLVTSMVCGPEVDPQFSNSDKIKIYNQKLKQSKFEESLKELGLGGRAQDATDPGVLIAVNEHKAEITGLETRLLPRWSDNSIATEWSGFGMSFRPPRIVEGLPADFCKNLPLNASKDHVWFDIHKAQWKIGAETYNGILDLVRKKARPAIVGTSAPPADQNTPWEDPFNTWWTKYVDQHIEKIVLNLRARYKAIVTEIYLPALLGKQEGVLAGYLRQLNAPLKLVGWDVKLGALDSINAELDLYIGVLSRTTKANSDIQKAGTGLKKEFQNMGALVSDLSYVDKKGVDARDAIEAQRLALATQLQALVDSVENVEKNTAPDAEIKAVNAQALRNIQGLIGEMDSYWGIVRGIQVLGQ